MTNKKHYIKPEIARIEIDSSICLMMASPGPPPNPDPRGGGSKGSDDPFSSPFGDKPFS